ncbi:hypothetical protein Vafri_2541 [Volvox africanus]|uniref:SHSP domain-containing protein n=1 Tax=Volvox africanus TaxID=51714 RepID=A0A8J4EVE3_9CHLO|nr:hypothetical protein Vafri_2541 [Volvox africanus]
MAPKDTQKQQQQQQQRKQSPPQRRSWMSAVASLAKRVVDPFGLSSTAPRRYSGNSGNSGDAAAAGAAAAVKPNALTTTTTTTALEAEALTTEPLAAVPAAQQVDAGKAPKSTPTVDDDSCSGALNDVSEDLAADVEMADDAVVTAEPEGPRDAGGEYSDEVGGKGQAVRPRQATLRPGCHRPLDGSRRVGGSSSRQTSYPMDIYEDDSAYELQADVPGMREGDLSVEVLDRHRLVVEGNSIVAAVEQVRPLTVAEVAAAEALLPPGRNPRALRTERRRRRHFKRTFRLPHDVDHAGVTASIEDGVLVVRIAKLRSRHGGGSDGGDGGGGANTVPKRRRIRVDRLPPAAVNPSDVADAAIATASAAATTAVALAPAAPTKDNGANHQPLLPAEWPDAEDTKANVFVVEAEAELMIAEAGAAPSPMPVPAFSRMPLPLLAPPPPPSPPPPPPPVQDWALPPVPFRSPQVMGALMVPMPFYAKKNRHQSGNVGGGTGNRGDARGTPKPPLPPLTPRQMQM